MQGLHFSGNKQVRLSLWGAAVLIFMLGAILLIPGIKVSADYFEMASGSKRTGKVIKEDAKEADGIYSVVESDDFRITFKTDRTEYHAGDAVILKAVFEYIGSKDETEIECCDPAFIFRVEGSNGIMGETGAYYNKKSPVKKTFVKGEKYEAGFQIGTYYGFHGNRKEVFKASDIEEYGENITVLHLPEGTYTFTAAVSNELIKKKKIGFYAELHLNIDVKGEVFYSGNNLYRTIGKGEAVLIGTKSDGGSLDIPKEVKYNGRKYKVTVIGDEGVLYQDYVDDYEYGDVCYGVFSARRFTKVSIPSSVQKISRAAFRYTETDSVSIEAGNLDIGDMAFGGTGTFENGLILSIKGGNVNIGTEAFKGSWVKEIDIRDCESIEIGDRAFAETPSLSKINLPENTVYIGNMAFYNSSDKRLKTVLTIPKGTKYIGDAPTNSLMVKVDKGNRSFIVRYGLLLTADGTTVIGLADYKTKEVEMPEGITTVRPNAFKNTGITRLVLPDTVTVIPEKMAAGAGKLKTLVLGKKVTSIGKDAFSGTGIKKISLPKGLLTIGDRAFANTKLKKVVIPNTVTDIGNYSFTGNYLSSVTLKKNNKAYVQAGNALLKPGTGTVIGILRNTEDALADSAATKLDLSCTFSWLYGLIIPENIRTVDISSFSSKMMGEYYGGTIDGKSKVYEPAEIVFKSVEPPVFVDEHGSDKDFFIWIILSKDADREAYTRALEEVGLEKEVNFQISDFAYDE